MKVEMGESLMYSWLCHVKGCQIVQTNWKASSTWPRQNDGELSDIYAAAKGRFSAGLMGDPFKTRTLEQLIKQAEVDVLGISFAGEQANLYAVDIAFHEGGLTYGLLKDTVSKVVMKYIRTALCLNRYFDDTPGEILFTSPKINHSTMQLLQPKLEEVQDFFHSQNLPYTVSLYANEEFAHTVLDPVLSASKQVADTSELFMRSYQLCKMFRR